MTLNRGNLKIFKPEKLGQNSDAGGQRTRNAVVSGQLNELFRAISDIDHAQSAIDIVKFFPALDTAGTEVLLGPHIFLAQPPVDPLVNCFIVETPTLNDASKMPDMVEAIESSVTAGSLVRDGAPGFLPNQNSFSKEYLESYYWFDNKEYRRTTNLRVGQVICISVEYDGTEDSDWPRKQHYAQVTDTNAPGNSIGNIVFDPPIDFATPEETVSINGQLKCTKLRLTNEASNIIFHGVTTLTAAASAKNLPVTKTAQQLLPAVITEQTKAGVSITDGDSTLVRKTVTMAASSAQSYEFALVDVLQGDNPSVDYQPQISFVSAGKIYSSSDAVISVGSSSVNVTLTRKPDAGTDISLSYISTGNYANVANNPWSSNYVIVRGTISGATSGGAAVIEREDGLYIAQSNLGLISYVRIAVVDYDAATVTYESGFSATLDYLVGSVGNQTDVTFNLDATDPLLDTFYMQVQTVAGSLLSASSDLTGDVSGTGVTGTISNGVVALSFSQAVKLSTLTYNITERLAILPPPETYGLNPLRLPNGGVVDIFRQFGTVALSHTNFQAVTSPTSGQVKTIRAGARFADITDANGASLWTETDDHFTVDLAAGTVTLNSDFSGFAPPYVLSDTIGELALVTTVNATELVIANNLSREYPAGTTVASVQKLDDFEARVSDVRDMTAWAGDWTQDGTPATASMNVIDYPIEVNNAAAVNDEWVLIFTSSTAFRCVSKGRGQVATGDTLNDFSPINPATTLPFFTIRSAAFGGGWNTGEAVRFATIAASAPAMAIRTVMSGHSSITQDKTVLAFRGNES